MSTRVDKKLTSEVFRSMTLVVLTLFWTSAYFANQIPFLPPPWSRARISDIIVIVTALLFVATFLRSKNFTSIKSLFAGRMKWIWIPFFAWVALTLVFTALYGGSFELVTRFGGYFGYFAVPICIGLLTRPLAPAALLPILTCLLQAGIFLNSLAYILMYQGTSLSHWHLRGFTENPNIAAAWFGGLSLIIFLAGATKNLSRFRAYQLFVVAQGVVYVGLLSGQAWILGVSISLVFGPLLLPLAHKRKLRLSVGGLALTCLMTLLPGFLAQLSVGESPQVIKGIQQTLDVRQPPAEIFPSLDDFVSDASVMNTEDRKTEIPPLEEVFATLDEFPLPSGLKERFRFWVVGLQSWQEAPLGVGFGRAYVSDSRFAAQSGGEFHSEVITQLTALGPLGLLLWASILAGIWVAGKGISRSLLLGVLPVLATDNAMSNRTLWLILATGFLYEQSAMRSRAPTPTHSATQSLESASKMS